MFTIAETDGYYAAFKTGYEGNLRIYVDGSFNGTYGQMKRRVPVVSGWAVSDDKGNFVGYGLAAFKAKFTPSSEKNELRSMVACLETIEEAHPERISREHTVTLICDNKSLIDCLNLAFSTEKYSRRFYARHGQDYLRLLYFMSVMNVKFKWVKGHNENRFNCLADNMARKAFRAITSEGSFPVEARRVYLQNALEGFGSYAGKRVTSSQLRNAISRKGADILADIPTLWVGVEKVEHEGRTVAAFSFADTELSIEGSRAGVFLSRHNDLYLSIRAVNYALSEYLKKGVVNKSSLLIRIENMEAVALVNTIGRDRKWNIALKNVALRREVEKLREMIKVQHVLSLGFSDFSKVYKKYEKMQLSQKVVAENASKVIGSLVPASL